MNTYQPCPELLTAIDQLPALKNRLALPLDQISVMGDLSIVLPSGVPPTPPVVALQLPGVPDRLGQSLQRRRSARYSMQWLRAD